MAHRDIATSPSKHTHSHADTCHACTDNADAYFDADRNAGDSGILYADCDANSHANAHFIVHADCDADRYTNADRHGYANHGTDMDADAYRHTQ